MPTVFRPPTPAPQALVRWPEAFGTRFTLFVDTEEEFDWTAPFLRDGYGTTAVAALLQAHPRFAEREVDVVYLVDYPVAANPAAAAVLREVLAKGRSEIGAQLHPWVTPPFDEQLSTFNSFAGNLSGQLEGAKLDRLGQAIKDVAGQAPRIYRAGRYGLGPHSLKLLHARGYRIDTSMRSAFSYAGEGGPDFRAIGNDAFRTGPDEELLELPFTTVFTGRARAAGARLHAQLQRLPKAAGAVSRLGLLNRVALTPEGVPLHEALEAVRIAVDEGVRLLNFSFHSPSLVPGHTPYVCDAGDLRRFWTWWEGVLDLLDRLGIRPVSVDEILAANR